MRTVDESWELWYNSKIGGSKKSCLQRQILSDLIRRKRMKENIKVHGQLRGYLKLAPGLFPAY